MLRTKFPTNASILITNACNYNCSYCYTDADNVTSNELTTIQWKKAMDDLEQIGVSHLHIDGGESFDRNDVLDLLHYAIHDKKFSISIATNASLLNDQNVSKIDDSVQFVVRVDGLELSHEFARGVNSYKPTIKGLEVLLKNGKNVAIKTVVNRFNQNDLENLHNFLIKKNVQEWQISRILPFGRSLNVWELLSLTDEQWTKIVSGLEDMYARHMKPRFKIEKFYPELKNNSNMDRSFERDRGIYISPSGHVASTRDSLITEKFIDNILENNLIDILEKNSNLFERTLQVTKSVLSEKTDFSGIY